MPAPEDSARAGFPATRHSVIQDLGSSDGATRDRALDALTAAYWRPVYKYLRVARRKSPDDAQDLTQDFFAHVLEKDTLRAYDPAKGRFRTFLRVCLDRFSINAAKAAGRLKRGGGTRAVALDVAETERAIDSDLSGPPPEPEEYFRREWIRSLFESSLSALEADFTRQGKRAHFDAFVAYDIAPPTDAELPTYEAIGARVGLSVTQMTNALAAARRAFRQHVLDQLRRVSGNDAEFAAEARDILGVEV